MARRKVKKTLKDCIACSNTRRNSRGGECVCVKTARREGRVRKKKREVKRVAKQSTQAGIAAVREERAYLKTADVPSPKVTKRRRPKHEFEVTFVEREARKMITTTPGNALASDLIDGAIVRIRPGDDDTTEVVDGFKEALQAMGASLVKTMPTGPTAPALNAPDEDGVVVALTATSTPREAVEAILDEENDEALTDACEASMSAVGL